MVEKSLEMVLFDTHWEYGLTIRSWKTRRLEIPRGDPKSCQEDVLKEDVFKAELKDLPEVNVCGTGVETDQKKRRSPEVFGDESKHQRDAIKTLAPPWLG